MSSTICTFIFLLTLIPTNCAAPPAATTIHPVVTTSVAHTVAAIATLPPPPTTVPPPTLPPTIPTYLLLGNPVYEGVRVRITKPGLDQVTTVAGHVANALVPLITPEDTKRPLTTGISGYVMLMNMKKSNFKVADNYTLELIPYKQLKVTAKNIAFDTTFNYHLKATISVPFASFPVESTGVGSSVVKRLDIVPLLSINKDANDKMELKVDSCTGTFGMLNVTMKDYNSTESATTSMEKTSQDIIIDLICDQISKVIKDKVNSNFESLATITPLKLTDPVEDNLVEKKEKNGEFSEEYMMKNLLKKVKSDLSSLFLDYRMIKDPIVIPPGYIESFHRGEISWQKLGKTPFYPSYMPPIDSTNGRMLYIQISDYTVNSLIYHAYMNKILSVTADDKTTPYLSPILTTSCASKDDLFCFGNSFETIGKSYPNHRIQLVTYPTQPPYIKIVEGKGLQQQITGRLEVFGTPPAPSKLPQFNMFRADYSMNVLLKPKLVGDKLFGNVTVDGVKVTLIDSSLDKESKEDFVNQAEFAIALIAEKLDSQLKKGVSLPQIGYSTLVNPKTKFLDRMILIESDFRLDEEKLKSAAMGDGQKPTNSTVVKQKKTKQTGTKLKTPKPLISAPLPS